MKNISSFETIESGLSNASNKLTDFIHLMKDLNDNIIVSNNEKQATSNLFEMKAAEFNQSIKNQETQLYDQIKKERYMDNCLTQMKTNQHDFY